MTFPTNSFEQHYQGIRRCWRFGQKRPVHVDIVCTEGAGSVLKNLQRKSEQADAMFEQLVSNMNAALAIDRARVFTTPMEIPAWL